MYMYNINKYVHIEACITSTNNFNSESNEQDVYR